MIIAAFMPHPPQKTLLAYCKAVMKTPSQTRLPFEQYFRQNDTPFCPTSANITHKKTATGDYPVAAVIMLLNIRYALAGAFLSRAAFA